MTTTCPFCGAARTDKWTGSVHWFACGTMAGPSLTREDQMPQCITAEVARLTRERDEAINARNVIAKNIRAEMILKMQEVAKERDEARAEVARLTKERDEARTEVARLKAGGCARDQRTTQFCAEAVALQERVKRLEREVELLRAYGNKDCTWMADQHLESEKAKEAKP